MTTRDDFLRAVIARPQDDLPRLVFADWLDERGDPRGEFIRVQCELALATCRRRVNVGCITGYRPEAWCDDCRRTDALRCRERELLDAHWLDWQPLAGFLLARHEAVCRRGFIEEITGCWEGVDAHAAALTAATPLRKVTLTTWPTAVAPLLPVTHTGAWQALLEGMHPGIEFVLPRRNEDWHVAPEDREAHARDEGERMRYGEGGFQRYDRASRRWVSATPHEVIRGHDA